MNMPTEEGRRYWSTLTTTGEHEYTLAQLEDRAVPYAYIVFGDGGGVPVDPDKSRETLVNEVYRAPITAAYSRPENPGWLCLETVVPAIDGGWWVREIGAVTGDGKLIVVGSYPATYKTTLEGNGLARDLKVTLVVETTSSAPPELVLGPSAVWATQESMAEAIEVHKKDRDGHSKATTEFYGFTRLSTLEEASEKTLPRNDIAVTPAGLQRVLQSIEVPQDSMPGHLLAENPHPQYLRSIPIASTAQAGVVRLALLSEAREMDRHDLAVTPAGLAQVETAHITQADPHQQYFNAQRLDEKLSARERTSRPQRYFTANF